MTGTENFTLAQQKKGFKTKFTTANEDGGAVEQPPAGVFDLVKYLAPLGNNAAYVTPVRKGPRRPAIVWIHGGFNFGIDASAWMPMRRENDQSAAVFREKGLVLMLPSLRGTNDSPGRSECFLGEVEDIIAAGRYLATRPDVDPTRIYLGGHSTGGTMALLVAASTDFFRGVFSFGPVLYLGQYGDHCLPAVAGGQETRLRTPHLFLHEIRTPTFLIEGIDGNGPYRLSRTVEAKGIVTEVIVPNAGHFSVLRPGSEVVAAAIADDTGADARLRITARAIVLRMLAAQPTNPE